MIQLRIFPLFRRLPEISKVIKCQHESPFWPSRKSKVLMGDALLLVNLVPEMVERIGGAGVKTNIGYKSYSINLD